MIGIFVAAQQLMKDEHLKTVLWLGTSQNLIACTLGTRLTGTYIYVAYLKSQKHERGEGAWDKTADHNCL